MNDLPPEVKDAIKVLDKYKESNTLTTFDILHIYPGEIAFPRGYTDSRFFKCVAFNTKRMEKRVFESHDGIQFGEGCNVDILRVYADGSYFIRFFYPVSLLGEGNAIYMKRAGS